MNFVSNISFRLDSFVESNMSCICGAMTTLKPFFNHISPRILGSSKTSSSNPALSDPNALPTIGGTGDNSRRDASRRDKYERFDDGPMYPMQTMTNVRPDDHSGDDGHSISDGNGDNGSEKAIVRTRTTVVTYENRS